MADIGEGILSLEQRMLRPQPQMGEGILKQMSLGRRMPGPQAQMGLRQDLTTKGPGFLGTLYSDDGKFSGTELTIGVSFGEGKNRWEGEIPTYVPTLTKEEIDFMRNGGDPLSSREIMQKAVDHARMRLRAGRSVFVEPERMRGRRR